LLLHDLRQQRHRHLQLVLHLHCAMSGLVPLAKVNWSRYSRRYHVRGHVEQTIEACMFCSMIWVTESCAVCADAPGSPH